MASEPKFIKVVMFSWSYYNENANILSTLRPARLFREGDKTFVYVGKQRFSTEKLQYVGCQNFHWLGGYFDHYHQTRHRRR